MKLGVLVEAEEGLDWAEWRALFGTVERLGLDSIWLADHLESSWAPDRHGLDPWMALSVAAVETQRIGLGTLVSPITFRPPAILARMAEAVDQLRPGCFVLGLGVGWSAQEHAHYGIAFPTLEERVRMLDDGLQRIRQVLGTRRIPLLIGAGGPRLTLPLVARYADQWNMTTSSLELYRARKQRLSELCREIGREAGEIRHSLAMGVLVGRDAADLRARSARIGAFFPPVADVAVDQVPETLESMGWVVGTPARVVERLRALAAAGVEQVMLGLFDRGDVAALEVLASEVMPALG